LLLAAPVHRGLLGVRPPGNLALEQAQNGLIISPPEPAILLHYEQLNGSGPAFERDHFTKVLNRVVLRRVVNEYNSKAVRFGPFALKGSDALNRKLWGAIIYNDRSSFHLACLSGLEGQING
jgi:hypothetical protein